MNDDWIGLAAASIVLAGTFTAVVVAIWQGFALVRARVVSSRDAAFRRLVEESTDTNKQVLAELGELRDRVAAVEKLLRDVS